MLWILVGVVGVLIAVTELLTRYRDNPGAAILSRWGALYIVLNVAVSSTAFALTNAYQFDSFFPEPSAPKSTDPAGGASASGSTPESATPKPGDKAEKIDEPKPSFYGSGVFRALFAAFSGIILFRTVVRVGDAAIGPGQVIDAILGYLDRNIDRARAIQRIEFVVTRMQGVDFEKAAEFFSVGLTGAMQRFTPDEQRQISAIIDGLKKTQTTSEIKTLALGFAVLNWSGEELLDALVKHMSPKKQ